MTLFFPECVISDFPKFTLPDFRISEIMQST